MSIPGQTCPGANVNLPGLRADAPALRSLETILLDLAKEGPCILSLSGSLPKGCGMNIYANLTQTLRDIGAQVMLDTSGEALKTALDAPVKPLCAKPNRSELAAWTGRTIETEEDLIAGICLLFLSSCFPSNANSTLKVS